jgi:hypothetical protein
MLRNTSGPPVHNLHSVVRAADVFRNAPPPPALSRTLLKHCKTLRIMRRLFRPGGVFRLEFSKFP